MNTVLTTALNQALTLVITAAIPVLVAFVLLGLRKLQALIESKLSASQLAFVKSVAVEAVKAAEVLGANTYIDDKEALATEFATDYLKTKGITLDVTAMVGLIRAAYLDQIADFAELPSVKKAPAPETPITPAG